MKQERQKKLARRLALWSIADQIDQDAVNRETSDFTNKCANEIKQINEIDTKIAELQEQKKEIAKHMITASTENVIALVNCTENKIAKPLVDLAFWNKISESNPELYTLLHTNMEEIGDEEK